MSHSWKTLVAALFAAVLLLNLSAPGAFADDVSRDASDSSKMMEKLARGLVNLLTGVVEIPKNIAREWRRTDPFTGTIIGTIKGIGWGWGRTMSGAYDIVTFPLPIPEGYVPLMEPEYVMTDVWGATIPEVTEFPDW